MNSILEVEVAMVRVSHWNLEGLRDSQGRYYLRGSDIARFLGLGEASLSLEMNMLGITPTQVLLRGAGEVISVYTTIDFEDVLVKLLKDKYEPAEDFVRDFVGMGIKSLLERGF